MANVEEDEAEAALKCFLQADDDSRSPEWRGKRIEKVDGGIKLLNHAKYREKQIPESRREYMRRYMKERRAKKDVNVNVNNVSRSREKLTDEEGREPWRDSYRHQASASCMIPPPDHLPEVVRSALVKFSEWRKSLATVGRTKKDCSPWTPQMIDALHTQTSLHIENHPPDKIADRILGAIASGYRGVKFTTFFTA